MAITTPREPSPQDSRFHCSKELIKRWDLSITADAQSSRKRKESASFGQSSTTFTTLRFVSPLMISTTMSYTDLGFERLRLNWAQCKNYHTIFPSAWQIKCHNACSQVYHHISSPFSILLLSSNRPAGNVHAPPRHYRVMRSVTATRAMIQEYVYEWMAFHFHWNTVS